MGVLLDMVAALEVEAAESAGLRAENEALRVENAELERRHDEQVQRIADLEDLVATHERTGRPSRRPEAGVIVCNLVPVAGGRTCGFVDLVVPPDGGWNLVFRRCAWILDDKGERVEVMYGVPFEFLSPLEGPKFQRLALDGARALVGQRLPLR